MKPLLVMSFATALSAFFGPRLVNSDYAIYASLLLSICWVLLFATGLFEFKKRGLWLLLGLPLVLYWPLGFSVPSQYKSLPVRSPQISQI
jgi:hypothetical protein